MKHPKKTGWVKVGKELTYQIDNQNIRFRKIGSIYTVDDIKGLIDESGVTVDSTKIPNGLDLDTHLANTVGTLELHNMILPIITDESKSKKEEVKETPEAPLKTLPSDMNPSDDINLTRDDLVLIWQALELRTASIRCAVDMHGGNYKSAAYAVQRSRILTDKIHKQVLKLSAVPRKE